MAGKLIVQPDQPRGSDRGWVLARIEVFRQPRVTVVEGKDGDGFSVHYRPEFPYLRWLTICKKPEPSAKNFLAPPTVQLHLRCPLCVSCGRTPCPAENRPRRKSVGQPSV